MTYFCRDAIIKDILKEGADGMDIKITDDIKYIGVDDTTLDLFESQYVIPDGVSYNSYLILDEKIAVIDTVDEYKLKEWEEKLENELNGRKVDYLIIQHLEPDHAGGIVRMMELFPEITLVGNKKTFLFLAQYIKLKDEWKILFVSDRDMLDLGKHKLSFFIATMVHWPEVMVTFDATDKVLFSADAFGKFGALSLTEGEEWADEARRYYFNICGKYGIPVQSLLGKINSLHLKKICPAHGPVLSEPLEEYINLYDKWSKYEPESKGILIVYGSFHGNTAKAAEYFADMLREMGEEKVVVVDLVRSDMAEVVADAFRYDRMVIAAASYDAGVFPEIKDFLYRLQMKNYQKRKVCIIENGTWSPSAGRVVRELLEQMKEVEIAEPVVTIYSTLKEENLESMRVLAMDLTETE